jgi:hypothetical protein
VFNRMVIGPIILEKAVEERMGILGLVVFCGGFG